MAIDLSDDELLNEIKRRKLPLTGEGTMVKLPMPATENPTIWRKSDVGTALDRPAYDQRSGRTRLVTDPNAATAAEVAVIRAARTRNPNTPGNFESMTDGARAEHWDRYFKGPPTPASNFPVASDFAGPQSPAQFWQNYAAVRTGKPVPFNADGTRNVPTPEGIASTAGTGAVTQTPYGQIASTTAPTPDVKSGRFANGQNTWGFDDSMPPDKSSPRFGANTKTWGATSLGPPIPVSPIPPTRKSLDEVSPEAYPNIDQSLPPVTGAPVSVGGPAGSSRMPLFDLMDQRSEAARQARGSQRKIVETPQQRQDRLFRSTASGYDLGRMASNAINSAGDFLSRRLRGDPNGLSLF